MIRPQQALDFLAPLPVGRLPGVGKVTETRLRELGVETVGALREQPLPALLAAFGRYGERLYELARGIDGHAVESERPTQSISAEDTFAEDVPLAATADTILTLATRVWTAQQQERRIGRSVVLKLKTAQFRLLTRTLTPGHPPASAEELAVMALALRQRVDLPASTRYRLVGVGLGNFVDAASGANAQADLFG